MWSSWVQGNSNGPLVPAEKHIIPMVLLVNMHLIIKGDLDYVYIGHVCFALLAYTKRNIHNNY